MIRQRFFRSSGASTLATVAAVATLIALTGVGCRPYPAGTGTANTPGGVEARGVIAVTGTGFEQQIVARTAGGVMPLVANPADSVALTRLAGVEVVLHGVFGAHGLNVRSFTAVRVGDAPVMDGVVVANGSSLALETTGGRVALGNPPAALRDMLGARVWVSGPVATGPNSYGVIVPRP